jgi:hypothetical protein
MTLPFSLRRNPHRASHGNCFLSWQADTPPRTGSNFRRGVLEEACRAIGTDSEIDEAHRDLTVDSDTQGVPGHPRSLKQS